MYDPKYLQECIAKAKNNLSNIKDVDAHLDEIRGYDYPTCEDKPTKELVITSLQPKKLTEQFLIDFATFFNIPLSEVEKYLTNRKEGSN